MDFFFLSAGKPINKRYELSPTGEIIKHPYPFVYEVTSYAETAKDLKEFERLIRRHAAQGHTLLKGMLHRPLIKESRAGTTDSDEMTKWICLDLDGIDNYQTVDLFLQDIGCGDVDYVLQWSSSMGIENNSGFRCHIFMELAQPMHPKILKHWLMDLNLRTKSLAAQCELTRTGNALRWPLDVTTCQNDKLLYIAPPDLGTGIIDPFPTNQRISFVRRKYRTLSIKGQIPSRDALRTMSDAKVAELRAAQGLPARKATKYKYAGAIEYMESPDSAVVTEMKLERGFVYLNLNGGTSWGYYHPEDNPMFIYNFKGEPTYKTEDLVPDYWAQVQQRAQSYTPNSQGIIHLAFRDFRTSNYYNGFYDTANEKLDLAMAKTEGQLRQFMKQHGQPVGDYIPDWNIVWDPHSTLIVDTSTQELNMYQPSPFFKEGTFNNVLTPPPTIDKVIRHVIGGEPETVDHFYNWLAVIVQNLGMTGTAWVLQGTQGTGKGVLYHHILTPILGEENVVSKRMEELESEFTGFMENKFLVFIDEIEAGKSLYHTKVTAKLKNLIVEPSISIRKMYHPPYMAKNYSNMIFASNKPGPVEVSPDDRRFNVGSYQPIGIKLTSKEVEEQIPDELHDFFSYLMSYPADTQRARKPLQSAARDLLIDISQTSVDSVTAAILRGDLEFLWDCLPSSKESVSPLMEIKLRPYKALVKRLVGSLPTVLTRDDLHTILEWCVGDVPKSPHKFTSYLKHHRIHLDQVWADGRNVRGINVSWNYEQGWLDQVRTELGGI